MIRQGGPENYRPVSNLTFVSKLLERIVSEQLTTFLESINALPESQSAYRRFHSTESALLKVFSDLNIALAHGHVTLLGLLDLSAALDTVDYDVLLKRQEISYGVTGVPVSSRPITHNCHQPIQIVSSQTQFRCATKIGVRSDTIRPLHQRRRCDYYESWSLEPLLRR